MLVYKEVTATVAMMISGGRGIGRDRILSRKCLVSWTWEERDLTKDWRWALMYAEMHSVGESMRQPWLPGLCILGRRYRGWGLRSKEMSVLEKPLEGPAVEMRW